MTTQTYVLAAGNERGGAASHLVTLAEAIRVAGVADEFRFLLVGGGYVADRLRPIMAVHQLPSHPMRVVPALRTIVRQADGPVLIHAHGPRMNVVARVAFGARIPWTTTLHSDVYQDFLSSRWKSVVLPRLNLFSLHKAVGVFLVNPEFAKFVSPKPTVWVPNSVAQTSLPLGKPVYEQMLRTRIGAPESARLVGLAARFDPVKDIPTLVRAIHHLKRPDVHLVIAGDGPALPAIERAIADCQLAAQVHLLGFIDDVASFYAGLAVHVLPSHSEGAPTSLLEAGLHGAVNVGTDIAGIRRMLTHDETGLCFPVGDAKGLAVQLNRVLDDATLAAGLVERFRSSVLPRYTPERMLEAYRTGYAQFVKAAGVVKRMR